MFYVLVGIAAAFNLKTYQYDAVNAFKNSYLNELMFCHMPEEFA